MPTKAVVDVDRVSGHYVTTARIGSTSTADCFINSTRLKRIFFFLLRIGNFGSFFLSFFVPRSRPIIPRKSKNVFKTKRTGHGGGGTTRRIRSLVSTIYARTVKQTFHFLFYTHQNGVVAANPKKKKPGTLTRLPPGYGLPRRPRRNGRSVIYNNFEFFFCNSRLKTERNKENR